MQIRQEKGCYTLYKENEAIGTAVVDGTTILRLEVVPRWRGRGYGSYLLKEILRQNGGLDPKQATRFTTPLPRDAAGRALAQKYGFAPDGSQLVRRRPAWGWGNGGYTMQTARTRCSRSADRPRTQRRCRG